MGIYDRDWMKRDDPARHEDYRIKPGMSSKPSSQNHIDRVATGGRYIPTSHNKVERIETTKTAAQVRSGAKQVSADAWLMLGMVFFVGLGIGFIIGKLAS